jgi:hypothetical protein
MSPIRGGMYKSYGRDQREEISLCHKCMLTSRHADQNAMIFFKTPGSRIPDPPIEEEKKVP